MAPIPKHPSARRRTNPTVPMTRLPASGYQGPIPAWPLHEKRDRDRRDRELDLWQKLWRTPVACAWERLGWEMEVAMYVRCFAVAELGDLAFMAETRMLSDRLGLNPVAMLRLRWEVAPDENATVHELPMTGTSGSSAGKSARERAAALGVKAVAGDEDVEDAED